MTRVFGDVTLATLGLVLLACGGGRGDDNPTEGVLAQVANGDYVAEVIPPLSTGCGLDQPGYDADTYDVFNDQFCTATSVYRWSSDDSGIYRDDWLYVARMGEPDPDAELARWHHSGGLECHFRWVAESEPWMDYPTADIERVTLTLVDVDWDCDCENIGDRGFCVGEENVGFLYRSTDPEVRLWLGEADLAANGGDVLFRGFVGAEDTGGWMPGDETAGWMFHDRKCAPTRVDGEAGPGFCGEPPMCRYFSGDGVLDACQWQHIHALPANPTLIDLGWREAHADFFADVFGAQ